MIEYLEKLLDDKEYGKALEYAEQLLRSPNSREQMAAIYSAVLDGRVHLTDYSGAVVAGEIAVRLAKESYEWDCFGAACVNLGAAYYFLGDWNQAIHYWVEFLAVLTLYQKSSKYEVRVRYNLGLVQTAQGDFVAACSSMQLALAAADRLGDEQVAHGVRLALVGSLLKVGNTVPIPRLLARSGQYLRCHRESTGVPETELWHTKVRIEYTIATNRLAKARRLAVRGLLASEARSDHQFAFHMMLASLGLHRGSEHEALGHFVAARTHAIQCHRSDLEIEAGNSISQLTAQGSDLMQMLDDYYLWGSALPIEEELNNDM